MRRILALVTVSSSICLGGCEDGPNQTYSRASPSAVAVWNGSPGSGGLADGGAFVPDGSQNFDAGFGGTNANDICTADQEKAVWNRLFKEPIQVPGLAGGIDIAGGYAGDGASGYDPSKPFAYDPTKETWSGATVEQAEKILCQGTADSVYYGVTSTIGWGNGCPNCELSALYNTSSRQITDLLFQYGYAGTLDATSADGKTKYSISLNNVPISQTTSSGTTQLLLDWTNPATFNPIVNGLYDALRATYEPTFPSDVDCIAAGHCVIGNDLTAGGYLFFTPLNLTIYVSTTVGSAQANSIPTLVDLGLLKLLPFSNASILMKLDSKGEGPLAITPNVAGSGKSCTYRLGMTFGDFDANCLEPLPAGNPNNTIAKKKLLGAMSHGDEAYQFNIIGIDPQFVANLQPGAVISDSQQPSGNDLAYDLAVDQFELGSIANDYVNNDTTKAQDLHGLGMVTLEWANLLQHYMQANHGVTTELGDPACLAPNTAAQPGAAGVKCSGLEGVMTTAPNALLKGACTSPRCSNPDQMMVNALGPAALATPGGPYLAAGLKPGTWYAVVCNDAGGLDLSGGAIGYGNCIGGGFGFQGQAAYYFDTLQDAVLSSYPAGTVLQQLPSDLASRRFFFQQWILAVVKYMQTADQPGATLGQIDANPVDPNDLFFDSAGENFENGVYVFRNTVNSAQQPPTALGITVQLQTAIINDFDFARYNFRGERALYTALPANPGDQPGASPLFLSNIVGSPVLQSVYGTYDCAINEDPAKCGGVTAPVDPLTQKPLYEGYAPAFGRSVLHVAASGEAPSGSAMQVDTDGYELVQSAMITLPLWANPFDPSSASPQDKTVSVLIPHLPKGAGVGFPVTIDGSRDKFYNTESVDFTGTTVNGNVDFEHVATGANQDMLVVRAIESQSYLGYVFACAQPSNTVAGAQDILAVRMYGNGVDILQWLADHPGAVSACGIQIKYSIYGNYADYISSLQNGVRLGLNPGYGGSVVSDATLFDPNVVATLGQ